MKNVKKENEAQGERNRIKTIRRMKISTNAAHEKLSQQHHFSGSEDCVMS